MAFLLDDGSHVRLAASGVRRRVVPRPDPVPAVLCLLALPPAPLRGGAAADAVGRRRRTALGRPRPAGSAPRPGQPPPGGAVRGRAAAVRRARDPKIALDPANAEFCLAVAEVSDWK